MDMFEQVNNINEVEFEAVVVKSAEDIAKAKAKARVEIRTKWRDELVGFGLVNNARFFSLGNGIAPIYLAFADAKFTERFGNSPRVTLTNGAANDPIFNKVCEQYKLTPVNNCGGTVEEYDFLDDKTAQELFSFLVGFEQAYRKLKNAA